MPGRDVRVRRELRPMTVFGSRVGVVSVLVKHSPRDVVAAKAGREWRAISKQEVHRLECGGD